jgi:hypothetical protein
MSWVALSMGFIYDRVQACGEGIYKRHLREPALSYLVEGGILLGNGCIYTSEHISLALLEKFVHANHKENMERIALLRIEIPDDPNNGFSH